MKTGLFLISAALILLSESCGTNFIYRPPAVRAPMFNDKGDINGQVNLGGIGPEFYLAYSPIKHIGFSAGMAGYTDTITGGERRTRNDFEFAAVPYYSKNLLRLEMPVGYAFVKYKETGPAGFQSNPYTRVFLQPTIGLGAKNFEGAFITRFSLIDYANPIYGNDWRYEYGLMLRAGHENLKFMMQFRISGGQNHSKEAGGLSYRGTAVDYWPYNFGLGVNFFFNTRKKTE